MANHSLLDAIQYRRERLGTHTAIDLSRKLGYNPRGSIRALLSQAGPFRSFLPHRDAFRFQNSGGWNMSQQDANVLIERVRGPLSVVKTIGIQAVRNALNGVKVVVDPPLLPSYTASLPDLVIDKVIDSTTGKLTDAIVTKILTGSPEDYGRCGGMAFAALDFFQAGIDVPEDTEKPAGGPLREFIWKRLLDSLDLNVTRLLEWTMQLHVLPVISKVASAAVGAAAGSVAGPLGAAIGALVAGGEDILGIGGAKVLAERSREELSRLKQKLDAYPAWPIGIIYGDSALFWRQHQILALRYQDLPGGRLLLRVWDNNAVLASSEAGETAWIVDASGSALTVGGESKDVKGILCEEYTPMVPPQL